MIFGGRNMKQRKHTHAQTWNSDIEKMSCACGAGAMVADIYAMVAREYEETRYCIPFSGAISALVYSPVDLVMIQQQKLTMNPLQAIKVGVRSCVRVNNHV